MEADFPSFLFPPGCVWERRVDQMREPQAGWNQCVYQVSPSSPSRLGFNGYVASPS